MPKLKLVAVTEINRLKLLGHSDFSNDFEVMSQFTHFTLGGEDGQAQCNALVESETEKVVGFLAYMLLEEDLTTELNFYVNVEFVYLHPRLRKQGNSRIFIDHIGDVVSSCLPATQAMFREQPIFVVSSSSPKSDEGEGFVAALDRRLRIIVNDYSAGSSYDFPVEFESGASSECPP